VLRNHAVNCIAVAGSNGWIIDHNEITGCSWGLNMHGTLAARLTAQITNNAIHDHSLGAYGIEYAGALLFESNEVSRGGPVQKFATSNGVTVRGNWFHHNQQQGSWFDGDATGCLVENNTSDDNGGSGFMHEVSGQCVYRNNTARRNGESCFFISTSRDLAIYNNTCEDNFRGINTFISCGAIAEPPYAGMIDRDLRDNAIHDNTVRVSATPTSSFASLFSVSGSCAKATAAANNQSNNVFARNTYIVPTAAGSWWYWIAGKTWSQWQAMGQDATGTVQ
jgi:parallel beta-helix repeat protein